MTRRVTRASARGRKMQNPARSAKPPPAPEARRAPPAAPPGQSRTLPRPHAPPRVAPRCGRGTLAGRRGGPGGRRGRRMTRRSQWPLVPHESRPLRPAPRQVGREAPPTGPRVARWRLRRHRSRAVIGMRCARPRPPHSAPLRLCMRMRGLQRDRTIQTIARVIQQYEKLSRARNRRKNKNPKENAKRR